MALNQRTDASSRVSMEIAALRGGGDLGGTGHQTKIAYPWTSESMSGAGQAVALAFGYSLWLAIAAGIAALLTVAAHHLFHDERLQRLALVTLGGLVAAFITAGLALIMGREGSRR